MTTPINGQSVLAVLEMDFANFEGGPLLQLFTDLQTAKSSPQPLIASAAAVQKFAAASVLEAPQLEAAVAGQILQKGQSAAAALIAKWQAGATPAPTQAAPPG